MDCFKNQPAVACADAKPGTGARRAGSRHTRGVLVPVCSWCLKVRDGAGAWLPAEPGLLEAAGRTLTHGVCPDCARDLLAARRKAA